MGTLNKLHAGNNNAAITVPKRVVTEGKILTNFIGRLLGFNRGSAKTERMG